MSESAMLHFLYILAMNFIKIYNESRTHKLIESVSQKLKGYFSCSKIWGVVKSNEKTSSLFENSLFFRIFQEILDKLLVILRKSFSLIKESYENSIFGGIVSKLLAHFVLIICFFIFIHTVIPAHLWHNPYGIVMIIGITVLYLIKSAGDSRYGLNLKKLDCMLIIYILSIFLSAFLSTTPLASMKILLFNIVLFLFVFIMVNVVKEEEELGTILYWIITALTLASLYGIWQWINHVPVDPRFVDVNTFGASVGRVSSTMGNANDYAEYLVLTLPFYASVFFNSKNIKGKIIILALSVLPLFNLAVTGSRSGMLGFLVAALVYVFLKNRKLIPVFILLGIALIPFIPNSIIVRMQTIGKDSSSLIRIPIWEGSLCMLKDYWITGLGLGPNPFMKLFSNYSAINKPPHSHMLPLEIWLELGFVGIVSFVWFIARIFKKGITSVFEKRNIYLNNIIIANIASLTGIITIGFVEYVWFNPRILNMFWINIGIFLIALNLISIKTTGNN